MIKINFKIPFFEEDNENRKLGVGEVLGFLNKKFQSEFSRRIEASKEKCMSIEYDIKSIIEEINNLDKMGKNIFSTPANKLYGISTPTTINYSTITRFLLDSNQIASKINSMSPTSKTISSYRNELNSIATNLASILKKINDLQKFLEESEEYRKYSLIEKEVDNINKKRDMISALHLEIEEIKKRYSKYSLNTAEEEISKLKKSEDIKEYEELKDKMSEIDKKIIEIKNELTATLGEVRRPINKILHKIGGNEIIEKCYADSLECINYENVDKEFSNVMSAGLSQLKDIIDKDSLNKMEIFQRKFNKEFLDNIKNRINILEDEKYRMKDMIQIKSKIFGTIQSKENERNEIMKYISKTDREIRLKEEEIEILENEIKDQKKKISNILYEMLNEEIEVS